MEERRSDHRTCDQVVRGYFGLGDHELVVHVTSGPYDGLVLDVPPQTGMTLGAIGAQAGETIDISNSFGARVVVFLTVVTCHGATVSMTWEEAMGSAASPERNVLGGATL
jgi:hypothetical protein